MRRCEDFCRLATELKINVEKGLNAELDLDHFMSLAQYHEYRESHREAIEAYLSYLELDLLNPAALARLREYEGKLSDIARRRKSGADAPPLRGFSDDVREADSALARVRSTLRQAAREDKRDIERLAGFVGKR